MAPWASFLPMLRASGMLGQRWHHIGLMLSHFGVFCGLCWPLLGKSWDHIGLILGHFGQCWDILGHVGTILGSCWAILGYFRICVGLCFGLGHFNVVEFSSMPSVCKKHQKYQAKIQFVDCVADGFAGIFCLFLFLSWGMLQLGYVCLMFGPWWAMSAPYWAHVGPFRCIPWFALAFVGQELGPYWAYLAPFWAMLGHCGLCRHNIGLMLSHFGVFCGLCWPLLGKSFWPRWDILGHVGTKFGLC